MTNTHVDQWGFQGIIIMWEILVMLFLRELLRDLANLNGVLLLQGSLVTMGNNNIFDGALARFGKISTEFLHLRGLWWNHCEIWENLNGVPSLGGILEGITARFGKISMEFLYFGVYNGTKQLSQRCRWRVLAWTNVINCMGYQLGKINLWGTMDQWVSAERIWENLEKSSVLIMSKEPMINLPSTGMGHEWLTRLENPSNWVQAKCSQPVPLN